jgi:hypothetical protein
LYIDVLADKKDKENYPIDEIIEKLKTFFPQNIIESALKNMIYSGFLIETEIGSRNFLGASVKQPENIKLVDNDKYGKIMNNNETAAYIYYKNLIREFQYIYYMSWYYVNNPKSALVDGNKNEQKINYVEKARNEYLNGEKNLKNADKEESCILFLIAMYYITKYSTKIQIREGTRERFKEIFVIDAIRYENHHAAYYPLDRMMDSVKEVMEKKISYCERRIEKDDYNNKDYFLDRKASLEILLDALKKLIEDAQLSALGRLLEAGR